MRFALRRNKGDKNKAAFARSRNSAAYENPFRYVSASARALLPHERLKDVPQPVAVLLDKFVRFRTPNELQKAIPTITGVSTTQIASSVKSAATAAASLLLNASSNFLLRASSCSIIFGSTVSFCWAKVGKAKLIANPTRAPSITLLSIFLLRRVFFCKMGRRGVGRPTLATQH